MEQKIIDKILKERRKNPNLTYYVQKNPKTKALDLYAQPFGETNHFIKVLCRKENYDRKTLISLFLKHRIYYAGI